MEEYERVRGELVDKLAAQQALVSGTLESQAHVHTNLTDLLENMNEIEALIEGLKDSSYNQMSTVFKKTQQTDKASDLLKMNIDQLVKARNSVMRKKTGIAMGQPLLQSTIMGGVDSEATLTIAGHPEQLKEEVVRADPFTVALDRIEMLLVEQKIFEGVAKFKKLFEGPKTGATIDVFVKRKKFENIIIEELKSHVVHLATSDTIDYKAIVPYVDTLIYFERIEEGLQMTLNYATKLFIQVFPRLDYYARFNKMMETAVATVTFLKEKFRPFFPQGEFFVLFSGWLMAEFERTLNEFLRGIKDTEEVKNSLEKVKVEISNYDLKGLGLDFLVEAKIREIRRQEEQEAAERGELGLGGLEGAPQIEKSPSAAKSVEQEQDISLTHTA
jgi:hypothetical protein